MTVTGCSRWLHSATVAPFSSFLAKHEISAALVNVISSEKTRRLCFLNRRRQLFVSLDLCFAAGGALSYLPSFMTASLSCLPPLAKKKHACAHTFPWPIISFTCAVLSLGLSQKRKRRNRRRRDALAPPTERERDYAASQVLYVSPRR